MIFQQHATLRKCFHIRAFSAKTPSGAADRFSERGSLYLAGYELELTQSEKESLPPQIARLSATKIGCVKGGFEQINNRKKAFQTASPFPFRIQHVFSCRYHYQVETFWKTHFKPKLVGNGGGTEWFHLDASDIDLVSSEMEKYASTGMLLGGHISNEPRKSSVVGQPAEQRPREKVRAILYKHKCFLKAFKESRSYLSSTEFELVLKALYKHPRSLEVRGRGVEEIFVARARSPYERYFCFYVKRKDGSEDYFSYLKCFSGLVRRDLRTGLEAVPREEEVLGKERAVPKLAGTTRRDHGKPILASSRDVPTVVKHDWVMRGGVKWLQVEEQH